MKRFAENHHLDIYLYDENSRVENCLATQTATGSQWRPTEVSPMPREPSQTSTPSTSVEAGKLETLMTPPSAPELLPGSLFFVLVFLIFFSPESLTLTKSTLLIRCTGCMTGNTALKKTSKTISNILNMNKSCIDVFFSEYDNYRGGGGHLTSDAESDFAHEDDSEVMQNSKT